jgi:hypothetical protein
MGKREANFTRNNYTIVVVHAGKSEMRRLILEQKKKKVHKRYEGVTMGMIKPVKVRQNTRGYHSMTIIVPIPKPCAPIPQTPT